MCPIYMISRLFWKVGNHSRHTQKFKLAGHRSVFPSFDLLVKIYGGKDAFFNKSHHWTNDALVSCCVVHTILQSITSIFIFYLAKLQ
jgi:hypothetical protein